ncbi:MAG: UDP-N-acetylmuramate dehydrogenase [Candidatus Stahlbacteria bacterium]|nr:MAG: UDP-N-acetylmuramate dehydrogenase [Candidatus Stahlbacteria bacterium]
MEDWRRDIGKSLGTKLRGSIRLNEEMAPYTTYRIGGSADVFVEVESVEDLQKVAGFLAEHPKVPWQILGGGTNVLYPEHYRGVVIHPGKGLSKIKKKEDRVIAGAGAELLEVIKQAAEWSLGGMDFLAGIPGSVGGALKGNAGAFGRRIAECVELVRGFDLAESKEKELKQEEIEWSYRKTNLRAALFIYEIVLKLEPRPIMECMHEISRVLSERMAKNPSEPSAGCVFVNPEPPDVTAGRLIDELGFKGRRIGDAMCSPQHANFIVNVGRATQADVLTLITEIKKAVKERFGYDLVEEIKIIRETMEEHNG